MKLSEFKIGDLVAKIPIIQGGMGVGISLSGLASAVANEGGIGVIATAVCGMNDSKIYSDYRESNIRALRTEIRKARKMTSGILGVNIMVALTNFDDMVNSSLDEGIDIIFCGAGLPLDLPGYLRNGHKTKLVPIVSSARAAKIICKKWLSKYDYLPDALVVEGPKAGGHLGFKLEEINDPDIFLEKIVLEVIDVVKPFEEENKKDIPIIAAGGVYTGEDIFNFLKMGVQGVQMATRFVGTHECDANIKFKQAYIDAKAEDIVLIKSPVGLPGRAINCIKTCDYKDSPYCIAFALISAKKGNLKHGFAFAGSNAYRVDKIISVKELIESLREEYDLACKQQLYLKSA
jgi:nitronate monooxygenase